MPLRANCAMETDAFAAALPLRCAAHRERYAAFGRRLGIPRAMVAVGQKRTGAFSESASKLKDLEVLK